MGADVDGRAGPAREATSQGEHFNEGAGALDGVNTRLHDRAGDGDFL